MVLSIPADDERAIAIVSAIQTGNVEALRRQLRDSPELAAARIVDGAGESVQWLLARGATRRAQ